MIYSVCVCVCVSVHVCVWLPCLCCQSLRKWRYGSPVKKKNSHVSALVYLPDKSYWTFEILYRHHDPCTTKQILFKSQCNHSQLSALRWVFKYTLLSAIFFKYYISKFKDIDFWEGTHTHTHTHTLRWIKYSIFAIIVYIYSAKKKTYSAKKKKTYYQRLCSLQTSSYSKYTTVDVGLQHIYTYTHT